MKPNDNELIYLLGSYKKVPPMPPLEGDEIKEGAGKIILIPNELLIRLPVLLAQIIQIRLDQY